MFFSSAVVTTLRNIRHCYSPPSNILALKTVTKTNSKGTKQSSPRTCAEKNTSFGLLLLPPPPPPPPLYNYHLDPKNDEYFRQHTRVSPLETALMTKIRPKPLGSA